jgi:hypothetical protein
MQTFTDSSGRRRTAEDILEIFNRGADDLHRENEGVRTVARSTAEMVEEGRWIGEGFSTSKLSHHPTYLGGNRDIRVTADDGSYLWLRWSSTDSQYRILKAGRPLPFYTYGKSLLHIPQTEAEFLRLEEEYRQKD